MPPSSFDAISMGLGSRRGAREAAEVLAGCRAICLLSGVRRIFHRLRTRPNTEKGPEHNPSGD
jgi:hypothetical protein